MNKNMSEAMESKHRPGQHCLCGPCQQDDLNKAVGRLKKQLSESSDGSAILTEIAKLQTELAAANARGMGYREALEEARKPIDQIALLCSCVNWMGGCKGEYRCNLGHVRSALKTIDAALANPAPNMEGDA